MRWRLRHMVVAALAFAALASCQMLAGLEDRRAENGAAAGQAARAGNEGGPDGESGASGQIVEPGGTSGSGVQASGGRDETQGGQGGADAASGGIATGGSDTGGASAGGTAGGGSARGGGETGGLTTGGNATGGLDAGGNGTSGAGGADSGPTDAGVPSTGGAHAGGYATAGAETGGTATGGVSTGGMGTAGGENDGGAAGGETTPSYLVVKTNCLGEAQAIRPQLRLCNSSSRAVDITGMTLKYWFDQDQASGTVIAEVDYGPLVSTTSVEIIEGGPTGADRVVSVAFDSGSSLRAGECTDAQLRVHTSKYTNGFDIANDYSYRKGEWIANELVGLYDAGGVLIWGHEPSVESLLLPESAPASKMASMAW
jgi:hypothetical protein